MNIQPIQSNLTFEAKKRRFISLESHEQLKDILQKMNNEAKYKSTENQFETSFIARLSLKKQKNNVELCDTRLFMKKMPEKRQLEKQTLLTIGKSELVINNKSGEITEYKKPFFTTWRSIMKKINSCLLLFNNDYHKPEAINKTRVSLSGFTKKGLEILLEKKVKK